MNHDIGQMDRKMDQEDHDLDKIDPTGRLDRS